LKAVLTSNDLTSPELSWLCLQPMLFAVRGKDLKAKREMYDRLNEGQQALYLFYSFHNHTQTAAEFYWFAAYNIHELHVWKRIRQSVLYFQNSELAGLMEEMESVLVKAAERYKPASPSDLEEDPELNKVIMQLHHRYRGYAEQNIQQMNAWVLAHKDSFLEMKERNE
jgi:hypothetical protein